MTGTALGLATTIDPPAGAVPAPGGVTAFSFGDPEPVLQRAELLGYMECWANGQYFETPLPMAGLARVRFASPHHGSAIAYKVNQLVRHFKPSRYLSAAEFEKFALNFLSMGNAYLQRVDNLAGRPMQLLNSPALYTRRGVEAGMFWWVPGWRQQVAFPAGTVCQVMQPDLGQEIYGMPEWIGALQSALLNEGATLFRRRYFLNGSHMGYVFYATDPGISTADADAIRQAMKDSKGPGNFRNLFVHSAQGKEKGIQILPIGEAAAKDEFLGIKGTTRDDILAAHRVPPQLLGIVPVNAGGFGNIFDAANAFHGAEIEPIQKRMTAVNDWLGYEAIAFNPYMPVGAPAVAAIG